MTGRHADARSRLWGFLWPVMPVNIQLIDIIIPGYYLRSASVVSSEPSTLYHE
jgi:hypothetical protein